MNRMCSFRAVLLVLLVLSGAAMQAASIPYDITVFSTSESGAEAMTGVIFPPQVALLGIGAPQTRPWVVDGKVVPRQVVTMTLWADHRVSDGRQAARFLAEFETRMKEPETL